jgi:hypothetical protein
MKSVWFLSISDSLIFDDDFHINSCILRGDVGLILATAAVL